MPDRPEWFTNPEHEHIIGVDDNLAEILRADLGVIDIEVDCGIEGDRSFTYHFRLKNVPIGKHGHACTRAIDYLSACTGYRFEVQCV